MSWLKDAILQLEQGYAGSPWYGKPLRTILSEIDVAKSGDRVEELPSPYQIARHILTWRTYLLEKLRGSTEYSIEIKSEADWEPTREVHPTDWLKVIDDLDKNQEQLLSVLALLSEKELEKMVPGKKYDFRKLIEGAIQHDIYHAGQLVTTAKIIGAYRPV